MIKFILGFWTLITGFIMIVLAISFAVILYYVMQYYIIAKIIKKSGKEIKEIFKDDN